MSVGDPRTSLGHSGFRETDKFEYTYDMSDGWAQEIRVERFGIARSNKFYPILSFMYGRFGHLST